MCVNDWQGVMQFICFCTWNSSAKAAMCKSTTSVIIASAQISRNPL